MADTKYYVRGQSDSSYESMTKEEILTAISGTVPALDSGFITEQEGNTLWANMLKKRRKLGANSFTEYLKQLGR